jgi:hypothetical protein
MSTSWVGSPEHKDALCRFFIETHRPYEPGDLKWPDLDDASRHRLAALPIWDEAVRTEAQTAAAVSAMGRAERDPLLRRAIALQGYEEGRHAELLRLLTHRYGIPVEPHETREPPDPEWAFLRIGYGECFDSFFAFGLFALARESGFFPAPLVELFEPVMQEEARHILFHVNWVAYCQARLPAARRPSHVFRRGLAVWLQVVTRLRTASRLRSGSTPGPDNLTMRAHQSFGDISARLFVETCLRENDRRLAPYDPRLLRPTFVPAVARAVLKGLAG